LVLNPHTANVAFKKDASKMDAPQLYVGQHESRSSSPHFAGPRNGRELHINSLTEAHFDDPNHQIDMHLRLMNRKLARAATLFLMICMGSASVQVRAQDSLTTQPATKDCPDLTGTYEPSSTAWIDMYHLTATGTVRPKTQTRQFATFQRRDGGFTLIWHMPRQDVLAEARLQAQRDPHKYGIWLDKILRDPQLPLPLGMNEQEWFNRLAIYGPVFRVDVVLPLRQCKDGWFLFASGSRGGPADFEGGMDGARNVEFWLGRDKDGSLKLKWKERRKVVLLGGRYFNEVAIPLWSSTHLDKWPAAPELDLTPIRAEEVPDGNRPSRRIPKCQITGDHEALFFQRLKAKLPPGVAIENRSSSIIHGRMRPDGICDPTPYTLTVSSPDAADIAKVEDYLRTDPFIREISSQESQTLWDGRLMVKFSMMAAP